MFQNYRDDICYYIPGGSPLRSARRDMGEGSRYLDVTIGADEVSRAVAAVSAPILALSEGDDELDALLVDRMGKAFEGLRSAREEPKVPAVSIGPRLASATSAWEP